MTRKIRYLLLPISIVYGAVICFRNWLFDKKILKSASFNFPIICVGNLATGGTGKTPMTEYLVELLRDRYKTATLSRGYKRKTKGFAIADSRTTANDIGDEPMQFHQKFPEITVAVGEERLVAIPQILHQRPETQVILLDDAFQHRTVKAGLNLLLTDCNELYTRELMLPAGNLRDVRSGSKRADAIIVTKCDSNLTNDEKENIVKEISPAKNQQIFFTDMAYSLPYHLFNKTTTTLAADEDILLLCGIANPTPLTDYLRTHVNSYNMIRYADHHIFTIDDLKEIKRDFQKLESPNKIILTTEKDGVRLEKFKSELADFPIYVLPVKHRFLFGQASTFDKLIVDFVESFTKK